MLNDFDFDSLKNLNLLRNKKKPLSLENNVYHNYIVQSAIKSMCIYIYILYIYIYVYNVATFTCNIYNGVEVQRL